MKRLLSNFDWLRISIAMRPAHQSRFRLLLSFQNQSPTPVFLPFSNVARKAELIGLIISDEQGCRIEPQRKLHVRPANTDEELHLIPAQGHWNYFLDGEIDQDTLDFPGACYRLHPGKNYRMSFQYQGITSNQISWQLPPARVSVSELVTTQSQ